MTDRPRLSKSRFLSGTQGHLRAEDEYQSYQLIRNVLAASAYGFHFVLLCDGRRPDLLHQWWEVHAAIRNTPIAVSTTCRAP